MKAERLLVVLGVANLVILVMNLLYVLVAGWLPGR